MISRMSLVGKFFLDQQKDPALMEYRIIYVLNATTLYFFFKEYEKLFTPFTDQWLKVLVSEKFKELSAAELLTHQDPELRKYAQESPSK